MGEGCEDGWKLRRCVEVAKIVGGCEEKRW